MLMVRELTAEDIDAVAALQVRAWRTAYAGIVPADEPDRWRTGAGRALMAAARQALAAAGYPEFRLWVLEENHRARRFYERAGMAPDGDRDVYAPRGSSVALPEVRYSATLD